MAKMTRREAIKQAAVAAVMVCTAGTATAAPCSACQGSGTGPFQCSPCKGTGILNGIKCIFCNGKGFSKCLFCNGTGQR